MRLRLFETGVTDPSKATELVQDHLPAIGDLMSLEYGDSVRTLYRVVNRMFRVYAITQTLMMVDLEVEKVAPDAALLSRLG